MDLTIPAMFEGSIFSVIMVLCIINDHADCTSVWDTTKSEEVGRLQSAALPCKLHDTSKLDCSKRSLNSIPTLPAYVTHIDFSNNNLTTISSVPARFFNCPELLYLDFTYGNIIHLDRDAFLGLWNLTSLILALNKLAWLPTGLFRELTHLQSLDLSVNMLKTFPNQVLEPLTSLVDLDLSSNQISIFNTDRNLKSLVNLQRLLMTAQSSIDDDVLEQIFLRNNSFQYLTHLTEFDWLFNRMVKEELYEHVLSPLQNLNTLRIHCSWYNSLKTLTSNLTTLVLRCFTDEDALVRLTPRGVLGSFTLNALSRFPFLTTFALSFNLISISNRAFEWIPSLRKLDLNGNSLQYLSEYAFDGLQYLEELDLSFNSFTILPSNALQVFHDSSVLKVLNFANNYLVGFPQNYTKPFGSPGCLKVLTLSYNEITGIIPKDTFSGLPSLRLLDLTGNKLTDTGTWMPLMKLEELYFDDNDNDISVTDAIRWGSPVPSLKVLSLKNISPSTLLRLDRGLAFLAPNLENLTLSGSSINTFSFIKECYNLKMLDLSNNNLDSNTGFYNIYINDGWMTLNFSKIEVLILSKNKLSYLEEGTFDASPLLLELYLSENVLNKIALQVFKGLQNLRKLDLSWNKLTSLEPLLNLPSAEYVSVSFNKIVDVPEDFLPTSMKSTLKELDLSGNPLQCSCKAKSFQSWILTDQNVILKFDPGFYDCASPEDFIGVVITDVPLDCKSHFFVYLGTGMGFLIITSVLIFVSIKYRWHIRYKLFLIFKRSKRDLYLDEEALVESPSRTELQSDAYVAYNEGDEDWVLRELLPKMEDAEAPVRLFIGARDFPLGECILDCIVNGVQRSRKTVLVLSPRFAEDEWCYFEMQMAQQRLFQEGRDVLIMVLLEEIPCEKLTMLMRHMLCQKDYLKWPEDNLGQDLFWQRLKEELRKPSRVDRINEM